MKVKKAYKYILESIKTVGVFKSIFIFFLSIFKFFIPLALAYLFKKIVDLISFRKELNDFIVILVIIFSFFFFEKLINILNDFLVFSINLFSENKIRKKNIEKITKLEYEYLENPYTYHLFSAVNTGTNIHPLYIVIRGANFFSSFILISFYFIIIFLYNIYLIILPLIFIVFDFFMKRKTEKLMFESNYNKKIIDLNNRTNYFGSLNNPVYFFENYTYNTSKLFKEKLNENHKKLFKEKRKFLKKFLIFEILEKFIYVVVIYLSYTFLAYNAFNKEVTIGNFIFYNSIIISIFSTAIHLTDDYTFIIGHLKIKNMFDEFYNLPEKKKSGVISLNTCKNHYIEFKNVSFKYPNSSRFVFKNVSFKIKPNEVIAIVGKNGCGKTTLVKVLCGLYKVNFGKVLIDNVCVDDINQKNLSAIMNVMQQKLVKLSLTIQDYVTAGTAFDEKRFIKCLKDANFYDDFIKKNYTIYTILGKQFDQNGIELSTGQWQKLYMSRVLYNKKSINILDEPTSSMDAKSENNFFVKAKNIFLNQNLIFISHRLSVVGLCDKVIYFDNDKVIFDTHENLLESNDNYRNSYNSQKGMYYDGSDFDVR